MKILNSFNFVNLPVPEKKETLLKFLEYVQPLISNNDYQLAQREVDKYLNDAISNKLHNILLNQAKDLNNSWLVEWWIKYMYLSSRGPVTPECNAPMIFSHENIKTYDLAANIAIMVSKITEVYLELKKNHNLINDQTFNTKKHFSLDQLIYLFASLREPDLNFDTYYTNELTSDFIIIYKHNIAYRVQVIEDGVLISLNEIYMNIKQIFNSDKKQEVGFNFISASTNRNEAKKTLDELLINENNQKAYQLIKDAIVIVCYDDINLLNPHDILKTFMFAQDYNRFHGKGLLISIDNNKNIVMCADHTKVDGGTEIYLMNRITQLFDEKPKLFEIRKMPSYEIINFDLNSKMQNSLKDLFQLYIQYVNRTDAIYIETTKLNKNICKQLNLVSPDGLIHLLYQIAQYKTNQHFYNTYVAVDTRNFFKGRTECIRPISNESKQFAIDFVDNKISNKKIMYEQLQKIFDIHYQRSKDCQNGLGINRYMLGLELAYNENYQILDTPKPTLFSCRAWKTITQNMLSTSSIVSPNIEWVYFDPVHVDGLGIFYAMKQDNTRFSISYWIKDQSYAKLFANNLEWAIENLLKLL